MEEAAAEEEKEEDNVRRDKEEEGVKWEERLEGLLKREESKRGFDAPTRNSKERGCGVSDSLRSLMLRGEAVAGLSDENDADNVGGGRKGKGRRGKLEKARGEIISAF